VEVDAGADDRAGVKFDAEAVQLGEEGSEALKLIEAGALRGCGHERLQVPVGATDPHAARPCEVVRREFP
jgi:hypothetical protein